ncbi:MAG TPA: nitronate monooxygenase [Gemmataceae bacterium]|jgi:NAD(P)H-dependent flavin oxidoreductase YrpB (nitropropane dioxygenase family)
MQTALCKNIGIDLPIIQAAMGRAGGPALAAAVSNSGGLGMLAPWWADLPAVRQQIRETRALTSKPFGVNLNLAFPQEERLAVCLDEGVRVVSFAWGDPAAPISRANAAGAKVLYTVGSAAAARRAVDCGVEIIVAQGWEAGGHVRGTVATMPLIPAVVDAVSPVPVVAAGGIADGRGLAAALALGAAGAWIGTRFLASHEAVIHPRYRDLLLQASENDTVYVEELFDITFPEAPHRVLRSKTVDVWETAGRPPSGKRPGEGEVIATSRSSGPIVRYQCYTPGLDTEGDVDAMSLWAGQSVGLVSKLRSAGDIVREIADEAKATLRRLAQ